MLSEATKRRLRNPPVTTDGLTATKWDDAAAKAKFANDLLRLIAEDFRDALFTKTLYLRLSMTFGMIAHYNRNGFAQEWFGTPRDKARFVKALLRHPCYGSPEHTFSDVEAIVQERLRQADILTELEAAATREADATDRTTYERLKARFEGGTNQAHPVRPTAPPPSPRPSKPAAKATPMPRPTATGGQPTLFDAL